MRPKGIAPITILTHKDKLLEENPDKLQEAVERASTATGSSLTHTFFITNYIGTEDQNPDIELDVCKVLNFALAMGERYVKFAKHDEKKEKEVTSRLEEMELGERSKTIRDFFDELRSKHSLSAEKVQQIVSTLEQNGIKNASALKATWKTTKTRLTLSRA
ncbi:uncharacterized protein [Ptychodera flava]|uniref:uncharacterized protein n=1 Tax=Ptychodera flava TaxID=63121 RepID=UPI00396A2973